MIQTCQFSAGIIFQSVLLAISEERHSTLDSSDHVAAMDLSKAFNCLPPALIQDKMAVYGLSHYVVGLIIIYLSGRKECVLIRNSKSTFQIIIKDFPQGSILDHLLFNTLLNDILYFLNEAYLFHY